MRRTANVLVLLCLGLLIAGLLFGPEPATAGEKMKKLGESGGDVLCLRICCPRNITVECSESLDPSHTGEPTVIGGRKPYTITYEDAIIWRGDCEYDYLIRRTWHVTDACGRHDSCCQLIRVHDTTPPDITCPPDKFFSCENIGDFGVATAVDNCDPDPELDYEDVITCQRCEFAYTIVRTWTATDACGNSSSCEQRINISDNIAPEITCPPDLEFECHEEIQFGEATATDNCDPGPVITFQDETIPGGCEYEYTIERTWKALDVCGNFSTCVQTVQIVDNTAPEITLPGDVTFECDAVGDAGTATATDNCDPEPGVDYQDNIIPGDCPQAYTIERTWTATDACGNWASDIQYIYVVDTTSPYFVTNCPPDDEVECDDIPEPPEMVAADNCDPEVEVVFDETSAPGAPSGYAIVRTWTATDDCGNQATCEQTLTVVDNTPPEITCPPETTFECDDVGDAGTATATDNCDPDPEVSHEDNIVPGDCPQAYTIERTWTATDYAGNSDFCVQVIHVEDTTDPYWVTPCPQDVTAECDQIPEPAVMEAADNCDQDVLVAFDEQRIPGPCPHSYSLVRTWVATDDCGNEATCRQTLTVVDTTAPEITCPTDRVFECDEVIDFGTPTVTDNCDPEPGVTFEDNTIPGGCPQAYTIERTWTATDACNNSSSCVQTIDIVDDTAPYFVTDCPADEEVECDDVPEPPVMEAADNCDPDVEVTYDEEIINGTPGNYLLVRTWTATDDCDNQEVCEQTLTVVDTTPPKITCPADITFQCDAIGDAGVATATDNCDPDPEISSSDLIIPSYCPHTYTIERTWTAKDAVGNSSSCVQLIMIEDTTAPTLICAADEILECNQDVVFTEPGASDNCDPKPEVELIDYSIVPGDVPCQEVHTKTWIAIDACGNESQTCSQSITRMVDREAPVLSEVDDVRLPCNADVEFTEPEASDNCDPEPEVTIKSTTVEPGPGICDETHTRCWVASDACGNVSEPVCQTVIRMVDTESPVLTCAPDKTIPFGSPVIFDEPEVSDNCMEGGEIEIEPLSSFTSLGPEGQESYTQCWIVFDQCGNASNECCQTITVEAEPSPYCTFACWDWCAACLGGENEDISTKPACIRDEYFYDVFPGGVVIGDPSRYTARWTSPEAVEEFGCGYGIPWPLRRNYVDPERNELGVLAGEILALRLNREFSCEGYLSSLGYGGPDACYGDYVIPDSVAYFGGLTIDEFLDVADQGVAGNTAAVQAYGANINHLWATAVYLNWLYSDCGGQFVQSDSPPNLISGEDTDEVVEPVDQPLPGRLELTVRPNPLTAGTTINLALPTAANIILNIYNAEGRLVAKVFEGRGSAGHHTFAWDGKDRWGSSIGSGVYFCRVDLGGKKALMQKLIRL